ncbi:MAG: family 10 glycosylhydrolase, partial [Oscillospiraceae bacterium]|nr:family 10 glycosylhydrolase [Oscillospiraceae bacterium]
MVFSIHKHTILLGILALVLVVIISMTFGRRNGEVTSSSSRSDSSKSASESLPSSAGTNAGTSSASSSTDEMRAVWVPYMTLDMSRESDKSEQAFQKKFDKIVETAKQNGMNTLVVHVRPFADSLYPSAYFPWSHLTGNTQGVDPGYDPLAYMVQKTHEEGLKFHAWLNPLRIQVNQTPSILSEQNPY